MFFNKISFSLCLLALSLLFVQCQSQFDDTVPSEAEVRQEMQDQSRDQLGDGAQVAQLVQGMPVVTLEEASYQTLYDRALGNNNELVGAMFNHYVEVAADAPPGEQYVLILNGELSDGTYLKVGYQLSLDGTGLTLTQGRKIGNPTPVPIFSCRSSICNNCIYAYSLNGQIDCACSFGANTCVRYYPDHDPN